MVVAAPGVGDAAPPRCADPRADRLDRDEQGQGQDHRPGQRITELRADLAVGANTRWIVVSGAGDQAGAKHFDQRALLLLARCSFAHALSALIAASTRASISSR